MHENMHENTDALQQAAQSLLVTTCYARQGRCAICHALWPAHYANCQGENLRRVLDERSPPTPSVGELALDLVRIKLNDGRNGDEPAYLTMMLGTDESIHIGVAVGDNVAAAAYSRPDDPQQLALYEQLLQLLLGVRRLEGQNNNATTT
jgi:hypothetical protein